MMITSKVTLKTLMKNRTRTIVTIIGVILSAAMMTAVTTFVSSMQSMMLRHSTQDDGSWHARISNLPVAEADALAADRRLSMAGVTRDLGYAVLEGSMNAGKPYVCVSSYSPEIYELYPFRLKTGRLPENENELMISAHIKDNGGVPWQIGDQVTLAIGDRIDSEGERLWQNHSYRDGEYDTPTERLVPRFTRTYTIVGVMLRHPQHSGSLEPFSAPGYTVVAGTGGTLPAGTTSSVVFTARNMNNVPSIVAEVSESLGLQPDYDYRQNTELLRYSGADLQDGFTQVLYGLATILILLIAVGSISLIYNSFAISVSERSKQFGLLAGTGATARQIRNSVFFEAGFISAVGIPLGILGGIGGIGVTLYLLRDKLTYFTASGVPLSLSVEPAAIIVAAVACFVTVLISAWRPSQRAARVSPIEAVRQTQDIRIQGRQVRTSPLIRRAFGMEGNIALKNFKRNRRRYRATVISLFMSILLFVSASAFVDYLKVGLSLGYDQSNHDYTFIPGHDNGRKDQVEPLYRELAALDYIKDSSIVRSSYLLYETGAPAIQPALFDADFTPDERGQLSLTADLMAVDDRTLERYLKEQKLTGSDYTDPSAPRALLIDNHIYFTEEGRRTTDNLFLSVPEALTLQIPLSYDSDGERYNSVERTVAIGRRVADPPLGLPYTNGSKGRFILIVSNRVFDAVIDGRMGGDSIQPVFNAAVANTARLDKDVKILAEQYGIDSYTGRDVQSSIRESRSMIVIINVFSLGFIVLITLISIANVFNTISTNVNLRRREFAMLKSVGMTGGGFTKMINFECLFYGVKALLYGMPASLFVAWLIYRAMGPGFAIGFRLPWTAIAVSVIGVFLVVSVSMMYAMAKVRRENIVDALKNENL